MKLLYHTEAQTNALVGLVRDCAQRLIALNFNNPVDDNATIRHHAYLKGKLDLLQAMLVDDFDVEQPKPETTPE